MDYTINYNDGKGKMTLHCEKFFARNDKGKFLNTTKPDIRKVFKLLSEWEWCNDVGILLQWFNKHGCEDLAELYEEKYRRIHHDE